MIIQKFEIVTKGEKKIQAGVVAVALAKDLKVQVLVKEVK